MSKSMATAKVGYLPRVRDMTHLMVPDAMALRFLPAGTIHFLDKNLQGTYRFSRGVGSGIGAWTPDTEAIIIEDVEEKTQDLKVKQIPNWFAAGDIISFGPSTFHEIESVDHETNIIRITAPLDDTFKSPYLITLYAKKVKQVGAMPVADTVVIESPAQILPLDELLRITIDGVVGAYEPVGVSSVSDPGNPDQYEVDLASAVEDPGDEATWYLRAHPAYISSDLIIPWELRKTGPVYFDLFSTSLVDTTRVVEESILLITRTAIGAVSETFSPCKRNQFVAGFPLRADSFMFGRRLHGTLQYEESKRVRLIAGELGYHSIVVDFPAPIENRNGFEWWVPIEPTEDGKVRVRFRGGDWQAFDVLAGPSSITVTLNTDSTTQLEVVWVGSENSYCAMGSWMPHSVKRAWTFQYHHLAKLTGTRWLSTGAIFKPALLSFLDLQSTVDPKTDAGILMVEP